VRQEAHDSPCSRQAGLRSAAAARGSRAAVQHSRARAGLHPQATVDVLQSRGMSSGRMGLRLQVDGHEHPVVHGRAGGFGAAALLLGFQGALPCLSLAADRRTPTTWANLWAGPLGEAAVWASERHVDSRQVQDLAGSRSDDGSGRGLARQTAFGVDIQGRQNSRATP
jgi:hypothetical protein